MLKRNFLIILMAAVCSGQTLPVKWEELTAADFVKAIERSRGLCLLPFGILEKHGPAGPLGTDLLNARHTTLEAVKQEYAVVFPEYYFGQIFEAKHQPGTIAYSTKLQLQLLEETTAEMARNGCKKILIVNGHGGNIALLQYFGQVQLESARDYVVYSVMTTPGTDLAGAAKPTKDGVDGHGGEAETARTMAARPDLVHTDRSGTQSGADLKRLDLPTGVYTGIWWYSRFPNHYAGDSSAATAARGQALIDLTVAKLVNVIRAVRADQTAPRLQQEFFRGAQQPRATRQ